MVGLPGHDSLGGDILETLALREQGRARKVLEIPRGRGDRAVEGARLEIVCTPNKGTGGSNPPLSATERDQNPVIGPHCS